MKRHIGKKLINYFGNMLDGGGAPAVSFEDIGKSRLMQLSSVKKAKMTILRFSNGISGNVAKLKDVVDD